MTKAMFSVVLLVTSLLSAGPLPQLIHPPHSQINFVAEAKFISCHGTFDKWQADVQLDPQKVETSSVKITIDAASINTRVERRDTHLRSKDFFAVDQFPQITFVSKKINKAGSNKYA